jgi:hypothetical protein
VLAKSVSKPILFQVLGLGLNWCTFGAEIKKLKISFKRECLSCSRMT